MKRLNIQPRSTETDPSTDPGTDPSTDPGTDLLGAVHSDLCLREKKSLKKKRLYFKKQDNYWK